RDRGLGWGVGRRIQVAGGATAAIGMMTMPFVGRAGVVRRHLSTVVVGAMFTTTVAGTTARWGRRAIVAAVAVSSATAAIEAVGVRTGRPFGRYRYTRTLRPQLLGVPIVVPLAWTAMAMPARETAHAALGEHSTPVRRVVTGAAALTAWDLFLDPQMVGEGFWQWQRPGRYRGIPLANFAGWFATTLVAMAILEILVPPDAPAADLVAQYATMGVMETAAFATFLHDARVAATGGAAMLPVAAVAVYRLVGQRS
ncbi:MAG: carotenoid biosynthesis protein, partial [Ilumatobacteraceae bacterium]